MASPMTSPLVPPMAPPTSMNRAPRAASRTAVLTAFLIVVHLVSPGDGLCVSVKRYAGTARSRSPRSQEPRSMSVVVAAVEVDAGNALGAEHGHVPTVVLDGEAQLEAVVPQVPHRGLLEVAGHLVVAPRPHQEEVPPDAVPAQPGLGEVVHPFGPGGEQHDAQVGVEEVEEHLDLLDDRVVAARLEERVP